MKPRLGKRVKPEQPQAVATKKDDFITSYADYADVFEVPREVHEWIACQLIASAMNGRVFIPWGSVIYPLDLWLLLLSGSGQGRNTVTDMAREIADEAGIDGLIQKASWGSKQAFYQQLAQSPCGLYIWPELSQVLQTLKDSRFAGVKEWLTDRYDNRQTPDPITYRRTGKKQDTPPIEFAEAPRINILATSSFDWFINSLEQADTTGGFIPRWLPLHIRASGRLLPKPLTANRQLIPTLGARLLEIRKLQGDADLSAVEGMYDQWYRDAYKRFTSQSNPALAMPFFNRLRGEVLKLAVIFEVSQSGSLRVSEQAMKRAIEAARAIEQTIFEILPTGMNREGAEVEKMAERICSAGKAGLSKSELTLAFKHWRRQEREERLNTLVDSGTVQGFKKQTAGRTALVYVHKDHLQSA